MYHYYLIFQEVEYAIVSDQPIESMIDLCEAFGFTHAVWGQA